MKLRFLMFVIGCMNIGNLSAAGLAEMEFKAVERILGQAGLKHAAPETEKRMALDSEPRLKTLQADVPNAHKPQASGVIVSFRSAEAKQLSRDNQSPPQALIDEIIQLAGSPLTYHRAMSLGRFVFHFHKPLSWAKAEIIVNRIRRSPLVESVEADAQARHLLVPNDPHATYQWNLQGVVVYPGSANLAPAWDITQGSADTVVAVVDTGVLQHPEFASRLLAGYDFVSDAAYSNDGDGRDGDASDPGDFSKAGECGTGEPAGGSSWHGTHVAGIIAATGNNASGIAGINWRTRILPVRVLGKCGGMDSDIIDGMLWAAGVPVPGVPANPYPAQVINMSLGGTSPGGCNASILYPDAINQIKARGALIVVAAGNDGNEAANYIPASCSGVVTVGAVGPYGDKTSYSNYSDALSIDISAPGGDSAYGNSGKILSTVDSGKTAPSSLTYGYMQGTSQAAPHVAGVASLALALDPQIAPEMLTLGMIYVSRSFPADSECTTAWPRCGAGIVDAANTLSAVSILKPYSLVYEYYNIDLNHYFRTGSKSESVSVLSGGAGAGWRDTKDYFFAWKDTSQGAVPVCRFYGTPGKGPNSHFYTADPAECGQVKKDPGWTYEGIAFFVKLPVNNACPSDSTPIYRLYNNRWMYNDSNHRFTTDMDEVNTMIGKGWTSEGLVMCAAG